VGNISSVKCEMYIIIERWSYIRWDMCNYRCWVLIIWELLSIPNRTLTFGHHCALDIILKAVAQHVCHHVVDAPLKPVY
jgi:hypothetical protein